MWKILVAFGAMVGIAVTAILYCALVVGGRSDDGNQRMTKKKGLVK